MPLSDREVHITILVRFYFSKRFYLFGGLLYVESDSSPRPWIHLDSLSLYSWLRPEVDMARPDTIEWSGKLMVNQKIIEIQGIWLFWLSNSFHSNTQMGMCLLDIVNSAGKELSLWTWRNTLRPKAKQA
jgi:hypothetical protein